MIITIQHNENEREYEGTSCVFAIDLGQKTAGALLGDRFECLTLLLRLIKGYIEEADLFEKIAFAHMIGEIMKQEEMEEEAC